jgi:hypothetical protein
MPCFVNIVVDIFVYIIGVYINVDTFGTRRYAPDRLSGRGQHGRLTF